MKVTVPDGVPVLGEAAVTVAVKVTDWPKTEGLADDATVVTEFAAFTTSEELAGPLIPAPESEAVMGVVSALRSVVAKDVVD